MRSSSSLEARNLNGCKSGVYDCLQPRIGFYIRTLNSHNVAVSENGSARIGNAQGGSRCPSERSNVQKTPLQIQQEAEIRRKNSLSVLVSRTYRVGDFEEKFQCAGHGAVLQA